MRSMATPATSSQTPPDPAVEAHRLVLRFLHNHGYTDTATAFEREASHANSRILQQLHRTSLELNGGHDLQDVVDEWVANRLARLKVDDPTETLKEQLQSLELNDDELPNDSVEVRTAIRDASNVLCVQRAVVPRREWDSQQLRFVTQEIPSLLTTAVDRTLKIYRSDSDSSSFELLESFSLPSPALSVAQHPLPSQARFIACATMEGSLSVIDVVSREVVACVKDHNKYIVKVAFSPDGEYLATLGYDKLIHIYRFVLSPPPSHDSRPRIDAQEDGDDDPLATCPIVKLDLAHTITTRTNPEAAVWLPVSVSAGQRDGGQWLVWTAREDNLLHYVKAPTATTGGEELSQQQQKWETEEWNLNENGDSFISFSILSISLHPTLPLLSLQTSTASARLLLYPFHSSTRLLTLHTSASQSDYFNPRHAWLPSGAGVFVNSEDGVVRLVDLQGRVRLSRGAHGIAAPDEELQHLLAEDAEGGTLTAEKKLELKSERARLRREADRGSSVVRDVEVLPPSSSRGDDKGMVGVKGWTMVSCGFDKTVKVLG
ncbi:hypothetical protein JCM10908_000242 [Rhodotorula pacifica]|uniref:uncharacterized protein n=1 Tax=Rhodotorula pacifica TaxID=1495444 RepID=UPI003171ECD7